MRAILFLLVSILLAASDLSAQTHLVPLIGNPVLMAKARQLKAPGSGSFSNPYSYYAKIDTLQDNFYSPGPYPDSAIWIDNSAFVNTTYPIAPINLGVATLDGLNKYGMPYDFTAPSNSSVPCDTLTSKRVRLTGMVSGDSAYFSFYYQAEGRGNQPQPEDSLLVEFRSGKDSTAWREYWSKPGYALLSPDTSFHRVMISLNGLDSGKYINTWFQFRFRNYATPTGNLDHWNIDCIDLRTHRNFDDTLLRRVSFAYLPQSFLAKYQAMPWRQYQGASDIAPTAHEFFRNNDNSPRNVSYKYQGFHYGVPFSTPYANTETNMPRFVTNGYSTSTTLAFPPVGSNGFSFGPSLSDTTSFQIQHILIESVGSGSNPPVLDTVNTIQHFYNYYAYDDGSCEAGFGLSGTGTNKGGMLAMGFSTNVPDSLKAVQFFWTPVIKNTSQDGFRLCVWKDGGNKPGALIYRSDSMFNPQYLPGYNHFRTYYLNKPLPISGGFYVGWMQFTEDNLSLGFDRNTNAVSHVYYKIDSANIWQPNLENGTPMIRPLFGDTIRMTGMQEWSHLLRNFQIYPNPATDKVFISVTDIPYPNELFLEVFDITGKILLGHPLSNDLEQDVSEFKPGLYFIKLTAKDKSSGMQKLLISR